MKMQSQFLSFLVAPLIWLLVFLTSCNNSNGDDKRSKPDSLSVFQKFVPSGWMGDGQNPTRAWLDLDQAWTNNPHSSPSCVKVLYRPGGPDGWAGIYWQNLPKNWCTSPGEDFSKNGFSKITFWARGENGGELVDFKAGGIRNCEAGGNYHDSFESGANHIVLTNIWTEYTIDLVGKDLSSVIGGFCWSAPAPTPNTTKTFYIDDVYYLR